jgi:hypothetical protein
VLNESPVRLDGEQTALIGLLLQRHRSALGQRLVLGCLGRVIFVGIVASVAVATKLTTVEVVAASLVAILLSAFWMTEETRLSAQIVGLERTIARHVGGALEEIYIESGYFFLRSRMSIRSGTEPIAWLGVTLAVILTNALAGGGIH